MELSVFGKILRDAVTRLPAARSAVFIDWQGETVDAFPRAANTDLRVIGAHWGIIYYQSKCLFETLCLGTPCELVLRFAEQQVIIRHITDEYIAIMMLGEDGDLGQAKRVMQQAVTRLRDEM